MLIPLLLLLLPGLSPEAVAGSVRVLVRADIPEGRPGVIRAEFVGESGVVLGTADVPANHEAALPNVPTEAAKVRFSTPIHEACFVSVDAGAESLACDLLPLPVVFPFGKEDGRVWARRASPAQSFEEVRPVAREWGGGYAVPRGPLALVIARSGSAASIHRPVDASTFEPGWGVERAKAGPAKLIARFVGPDGAELRARPRVKLEAFARPRKDQQVEIDAWNSFYEQNGVVSSGPGLVIDPLPEESAAFTVEFPGYPSVRIGTRGRVVEGAVDLGVVRVPRPTSLAVSLRTELPREELPEGLAFELRLVRPVPGIRPPSKSPSLGRNAIVGGLTRFDQLFPGEWLLSLRAADENLGEVPLQLAEGPDNGAEVVLTREAVTGRFLNEEGEGVGGAQVGLSRSRYSTIGKRDERTDPYGAFRLEFLHAGGKVAIWALPGEECRPSGLEVDPRQLGSMELVLRTNGMSSQILVSDASTAAPIGEAQVEVGYSLEDGVNGSFRRRTSTEEGAVRLCNFGAGTFTLTAKAEGYEERSLQTTLDPLRPKDVRIALRRAERVRGRVYGANGAPAAHAFVFGPLSAGLADEEEPRSVRTDSSGAFVLDVPPDGGPFLVAVVAAGHRLALRWLRPGPAEDSVVLTAAGADAVVTMLFSDGVPVPGAYLALAVGGIRLPTALLAAATAAGGCAFEPASREGRTLFGGCLEPGTYVLFARAFRSGGVGYLPLGSYPFPLPPGIELRSSLRDLP